MSLDIYYMKQKKVLKSRECRCTLNSFRKKCWFLYSEQRCLQVQIQQGGGKNPSLRFIVEGRDLPKLIQKPFLQMVLALGGVYKACAQSILVFPKYTFFLSCLPIFDLIDYSVTNFRLGKLGYFLMRWCSPCVCSPGFSTWHCKNKSIINKIRWETRIKGLVYIPCMFEAQSLMPGTVLMERHNN